MGKKHAFGWLGVALILMTLTKGGALLGSEPQSPDFSDEQTWVCRSSCKWWNNHWKEWKYETFQAIFEGRERSEEAARSYCLVQCNYLGYYQCEVLGVSCNPL